MKKISTLILLSLTCAFVLAQVQVETLTPEFPGSGGIKIGPDGEVYIANYGDALTFANGSQIWKYSIRH